jgi:hypothetical protein
MTRLAQTADLTDVRTEVLATVSRDHVRAVVARDRGGGRLE